MQFISSEQLSSIQFEGLFDALRENEIAHVLASQDATAEEAITTGVALTTGGGGSHAARTSRCLLLVTRR